jgi:hypothetical protein
MRREDLHQASPPAGPGPLPGDPIDIRPGRPVESAEEAAQRERIEREAAAVDAEFSDVAGPPGGGGIGPAPMAVNVVEENKALFQLLVQVLTPALPFLPECYPPSTVDMIARTYTEVEAKRGWNLRGMVSAEGALLMVALPPTLMAIQKGREHFARVKADREAAEASAARPAGQAAPTPAPAPGATKPAPPKMDIAPGMTRVV